MFERFDLMKTGNINLEEFIIGLGKIITTTNIIIINILHLFI